MEINTSRFGNLKVNNDSIITFPEGIPGFIDFRKYVLLKKDNNKIFFFLHSVESKDLMFILTNPYFFILDYTFKLPDDDCVVLNLKDNKAIEKLGIFVIVKIDNDKNVFLNLKAPICINFEQNLGKQVILYNSDYSHQYKLEVQKNTGSEKFAKVANGIQVNENYTTTI